MLQKKRINTRIKNPKKHKHREGNKSVQIESFQPKFIHKDYEAIKQKGNQYLGKLNWNLVNLVMKFINQKQMAKLRLVSYYFNRTILLIYKYYGKEEELTHKLEAITKSIQDLGDIQFPDMKAYLKSAESQLAQLKKKHLIELKSMKQPPQGVIWMQEALFYLLMAKNVLDVVNQQATVIMLADPKATIRYIKSIKVTKVPEWKVMRIEQLLNLHTIEQITYENQAAAKVYQYLDALIWLWKYYHQNEGYLYQQKRQKLIKQQFSYSKIVQSLQQIIV